MKRSDGNSRPEKAATGEVGTFLWGRQNAANHVLPTNISPDDWIRHARMKWTFLLVGSFFIVALAVVTIAIVNPSKGDIQKSARETQAVITESAKNTSKEIQKSTNTIVNTVQDAALANLETMFPLSVRNEREVDGTIMHLDGTPRQRLISYDKNLRPMRLHWGDRFHYSVFKELDSATVDSAQVLLEVHGARGTVRLPLKIDLYSETNLRIPGSSPEPMDAYLINQSGTRGIALKIMIFSADRERGREEFYKALMNTTLDSAARRIYMETQGPVPLLNSPSEDAQQLRTVLEGTYVKVKSRSANKFWCEVRLPEGREGWTECNLLAPIRSNGPSRNP